MERGDVRLKQWQTFGATKIAIKIPTERELVSWPWPAGWGHAMQLDCSRLEQCQALCGSCLAGSIEWCTAADVWQL